MIITQPLEITTTEGKATGRWRLVEMSDEHDGAEPLCECGGRSSDNPTTCGHESPEAARACPVAAEKVDHRFAAKLLDWRPSRSPPPDLPVFQELDARSVRTKDHPDVIAAWRHMVDCARAFVRCADEFGDDIGATAEHYDALERAQERLAREWEGEPVAPAWQMPRREP